MPNAAMPSAATAVAGSGFWRTSSSAASTFSTTTGIIARRNGSSQKHCGQMANASDQALASWLSATANSAISPAR